MDEAAGPGSKCPECGSMEIEEESEGEVSEVICTNCGYVVGSRTNMLESEGESSNQSSNRIRADDLDWKDKQTTNKRQNQSETSGWQKWYPCTECGSTALKQTEVAIVIATEDGVYGGDDDPDYDEKIECKECGTVLDQYELD